MTKRDYLRDCFTYSPHPALPGVCGLGAGEPLILHYFRQALTDPLVKKAKKRPPSSRLSSQYCGFHYRNAALLDMPCSPRFPIFLDLKKKQKVSPPTFLSPIPGAPYQDVVHLHPGLIINLSVYPFF
jgi:hypothetical protein